MQLFWIITEIYYCSNILQKYELFIIILKKRNLSLNRNLQFVIATTMSLITDEILDFCKEHKIIISSSLDGPEDLLNSNRPDQERIVIKNLLKA